MDHGDRMLAGLIDRCRRDHHAWINGDSSGYEMSEGGVILGAFGGAASGAPLTPGQRVAARLFESGTGTIEVLGGGRSGDLAWLALVERATVRFSDHVEPHRWELRVTEVFQRHGDDWHRVHRHADPLVERRSLDDALATAGRLQPFQRAPVSRRSKTLGDATTGPD